MKIYISSCVNLSNIGFLDRAMFKKWLCIAIALTYKKFEIPVFQQ